MARVPAYGEAALQGPRRPAAPTRGISVGNEWKYRSFIEGGTLAAAIWTSTTSRPSAFPTACRWR